MQQKMLCIILTCLVFNTGLIISSVVHSEAPIKVDEQTGSYLESLGTSQHRQTSVKYHFEQHGSQYSKDSINHRNNPMTQYSQDSINHRNNPGQHRQTSVKYHFEQHGSQYSQDSMSHRNSPRWDALVVNLNDPSRKVMYLQDSRNKRNNPGGKYYESVKPGNPASNVTSPHRTVVTIPVNQW
jgi:hypothetical protein